MLSYTWSFTYFSPPYRMGERIRKNKTKQNKTKQQRRITLGLREKLFTKTEKEKKGKKIIVMMIK